MAILQEFRRYQYQTFLFSGEISGKRTISFVYFLEGPPATAEVTPYDSPVTVSFAILQDSFIMDHIQKQMDSKRIARYP
eukprot:320221-Amorphochlora_amoeboformis.AAC.1